MPNGKTYKYFTREMIDAIPGIDDPMIDPAWIPYGFVQEWSDGWVVKRMRGNRRLYYPHELQKLMRENCPACAILET